MLTIRKISVNPDDPAAAARAARYPVERSDSPDAFRRAEYYTGGEGPHGQERANSMWLGSTGALAALGVERGAEVTREQLALALGGKHAVTGEQLRSPVTVRRPGTDIDAGGEVLDSAGAPRRVVAEKRVNSVDLTFSAPKSVSAVWSQARPELRAEIEQAMFRAANATLEYMLGSKGVVRARDEYGERSYSPAQGFAASVTLDVTARKAQSQTVPSPQLHVHGVVVGVERSDGKFVTPQTEALFKDGAPLEGGAVGRAVLADELSKLGFRVRAGTGRNHRYFEIDGVPQGLIDVWSARAREVEEKVREIEKQTGEGLTGAARGAVAMMTRAPKQHERSPQEIMDWWDVRAREEFGFGPAEVDALRRYSVRERRCEDRMGEARAAILQRVWDQGPTVTESEAVTIAFEAAPDRMSLDEAVDLLKDMHATGELVALDGGLVTTRRIREREQYVIRVAVKASQTRTAPLTETARLYGIAQADRWLGEGKPLADEQREAIWDLTGGAGWATLTGRAGTGKAAVLRGVAEAYRRGGWVVVPSAVDGATAQRLGHQAGARSRTLESVLAGAHRDTEQAHRPTLILIDEASKVGLAHWVAIARLSDQQGVRVIAVGHAGQLGAIELPGMFEAMLCHSGVLKKELTEVRRHRDPADPSKPHPWLGEYLDKVNSGADDAIEFLREKGAVTMHDTRQEAMEALVAEWDARRRGYDVTDTILQIHGSNDDVDRLNELAQRGRIDAGELAGEGVEAVDRGYLIFENDVVMLREAPYKFEPSAPGAPCPRRIENGTVGIVEDVDPVNGVVQVRVREPGAEPRLMPIDLRRLRERLAAGDRTVPSLRLGYAGHPNPTQGANFKLVGVCTGHRTQTREGTYTAEARAVEVLFTHTDRESLGPGADGCHGRGGGENIEDERTDEDRWKLLARRALTREGRSASIMTRATGAPAGIALRGFGSVPKPPFRAEPRVSPGESLATGKSARADTRDWLDEQRGLLGPERTEWISERAHHWADGCGKLSDDALLAEVERGQEALNELDRSGAWRMRVIESGQELVKARTDESLANAVEFESAAEDSRGWRRRGTRAELYRAAETQRRAASHEQRLSEELEREATELRLDGRDPDAWLADHGDDFARGIAARRELAARSRHTSVAIVRAGDVERIATPSRDFAAQGIEAL